MILAVCLLTRRPVKSTSVPLRPSVNGTPVHWWQVASLPAARPLSFSLMPSTLVECVPNFSEGRDKAKVDAIVEAMKVSGRLPA